LLLWYIDLMNKEIIIVWIIIIKSLYHCIAFGSYFLRSLFCWLSHNVPITKNMNTLFPETIFFALIKEFVMEQLYTIFKFLT
jgi:hypothetical protein